jgi:ABC-type antimicrobial peptide transport system permease subunit
VSVVIVALALLSIYSTLALRAEQMIAPLGMLRAIGMSDGLLSLIQVVEGLSLWIMAAVPGVLCALAAGHFIAARVCDHYVDAYRLWFSAPAIVQLPVLAMCCVMCIGGSWGSHWRTRNRSIMQCLSLDL